MKKAVVLGAYGFIGAACVRALQADGYAVCGVGRSLESAKKVFPDLVWIIRDISQTLESDWKELLGDADVIVNASGALQDGTRDNLNAIHVGAVERIVSALSGTHATFVQISAAGVSDDAPTAFFRTKARGDAVVMASATNWIILRPVLVLGSEAYGGSALLRASAATPCIGGRVFADAPIQTIHVDDLAAAVAHAAGGKLGTHFVADLGETEIHTFAELTRRIRSWLGYPKWSAEIEIPEWLLRLVGTCADLLGWLGWRSPLRTNALRSLKSGITGDPSHWQERGGLAVRSLEETLAAIPATAQERTFSRMYLLLPLAIGCLSVFWLLSGLIGILSFENAKSVLTERNVSSGIAAVAVIGGIVADLVLGAAVLVRRWSRKACAGMILVSGAYLLFGSWLAADLWSDPLGPFVKVLPAILLAVFVAFLLEDR